MLQQAGHDVTGLDSYLFEECSLGDENVDLPAIRCDVRDVQVSDLYGFDAVIHLAALSNDPLGDLDPDLTYEINHRASVRLAELAKGAGVPRFLFSSSCSLYGASGDACLTEEAGFNPVTPYGDSKIRTEQDVRRLAGAHFSPTFLRNATVYGVSPRLRGDLVVNNLTAYAFLTGEALIKSDGMAWRPLVHVEDVCSAFVAALEAPRQMVHNQSFNVGRNGENYLIKDVARIVSEVVPGTRVRMEGDGAADTRNYRVDFSKIEHVLTAYRPRWTVHSGVEQLDEAYRRYGLTTDDFLGPRYQRIQTVRGLIAAGELGADLRRRTHGVRLRRSLAGTGA
jgi:nucleoside-diphosphate-sugar epimerase